MLTFALAATSAIVIASPDKSVEMRIAADGLTYSVTRGGETIAKQAPLGIVLADAPSFKPLKTINVERRSVNRILPLIATKASQAVDRYNGATIRFHETGPAGRILSIEARAYNDGVAFRYIIPAPGPVAIAGERTGYRLPSGAHCLFTETSGSHERDWQDLPVATLDPEKRYDHLATCATSSGRNHFAILQSGIEGYTGSVLRRSGDTLQVELTPRRDRPTVAVQSNNGMETAWRVIMLGDRAGDLISSQLVGNLARQPSGDFSWVKPGKAAWDWWSGPTQSAKPTMERFRKFIDFAAASGLPYFLIDAGWALNSGGCCAANKDTDILRAEPGIDIPALVKYAGSKGVDLLLWVHWEHLAPRMEEVLDQYRNWGIKGIKVDFMDRQDQQIVDFYTRAARETAKRKLLLDMHAAFLPAGMQRTYPNYITQEGVMGAEYDKIAWGAVTPAHNVKLAYTRMLAGPMDYTPGGFRNGGKAAGPSDGSMPVSQNSRGQALAMYVVYDSPLQMVSDAPEAYANASGFDFIKIVPTAWDETRFIGGTPDSHIILARRKGRDWFIGAMNAGEARTVTIPLSLLGAGRFEAQLWQDGATPSEVKKTSMAVTSRDSVTIKMAEGGGGAIQIRPVD
ncbi:glycoside hydrolase family 97 protein [Sphingobium sp. CCH11-B1]|uniref:glycoside hydrolase family 97 protein n=1 Tax=Sphingobium sp. CCH11-B1 TaxID=1768781 RepID=UPI000834211F|nr:glycoside hydrolase family 97 protein [Sphingobium sp. CCH11-B1]